MKQFRKFNRLLAMMMSVVILGFMASCDEDEPTPTPPIVEGDTVNVADGMYFALVGQSPLPAAQMKGASVDAPGFSAVSREGFVQTYAYLTAGNYNMVEIESKAFKTYYGGDVTTVTGEANPNKECGDDETTESGYSLVSAAVDGAAFAVPTDGLYVIAYDATLGEIVYDEMTGMGIIGGGTPGGWGEDTPMTGTVTAEGGSWSVDDVTLDVGQMKFRHNCRWGIDRRLDYTKDFANDNGYSFFTNYGGSIDQLKPGNEGANIEIGEYANYTVTFAWDPILGVSATLTKTGAAPEKPKYPEAMYLVGDATAYDWTGPGDAAHNGADLMHKIAGGTPNEDGIFWKILYLETGKGFKISAKGWADPNLGFGDVEEFDPNGVTVSDAGGNMGVAESGMYMVVVNLQDDMQKVSVMVPSVYGIGDAFGGWDSEMAAALYTVDNTAKTLISPATVADGNIRTYVDHAWITDWWNAEFVVISDVLEYRNDGGDQAAVATTTGQVMTLSFDDNTGTIQ